MSNIGKYDNLNVVNSLIISKDDFEDTRELIEAILRMPNFDYAWEFLSKETEGIFNTKESYIRSLSDFINQAFKSFNGNLRKIQKFDFTVDCFLNLNNSNENHKNEIILNERIGQFIFSNLKNNKGYISSDIKILIQQFTHLCHLVFYARCTLYFSDFSDREFIKRNFHTVEGFLDSNSFEVALDESIYASVRQKFYESVRLYKGKKINYYNRLDILSLEDKILKDKALEIEYSKDKLAFISEIWRKTLNRFRIENPNIRDINKPLVLVTEEEVKFLNNEEDCFCITKDMSRLEEKELARLFSISIENSWLNSQKGNLFLDEYRLLPKLKENFNNHDLHALINCHKYFVSSILRKNITTKSINSIEELVRNSEPNLIQNLTTLPNKEDITFFLSKSKKKQSLSDIIDNKLYVRNFLHFRHLLTILRIYDKLKDRDDTLYHYVFQKMEKLLRDPLVQVEESDFIATMSLFFNPFDIYLEKLNAFWDFEYPIHSYFIDYYSYRKEKASCYFHNMPRINLERNKQDKLPIVLLSSRSEKTIKEWLYFTLSHEIGHHIQHSSNFHQKFTVDTKEAKYIGKELEADMFAGFFLAHEEGLSLSLEEQKSLAEGLYLRRKAKCVDPFMSNKKPHGSPEQRKRAFILGCKLANFPSLKERSRETKMDLHALFNEIYVSTEYLTNLKSTDSLVKYFNFE